MSYKSAVAHTKGAWRVAEDGQTVLGPDYPGNGIIATVNPHRGDDAQANARLIAAAPMLRKLLEDLLLSTELNMDDMEDDTLDTIMCAQLVLGKL
jgi:hypothetical protein